MVIGIYFISIVYTRQWLVPCDETRRCVPPSHLSLEHWSEAAIWVFPRDLQVRIRLAKEVLQVA